VSPIKPSTAESITYVSEFSWRVPCNVAVIVSQFVFLPFLFILSWRLIRGVVSFMKDTLKYCGTVCYRNKLHFKERTQTKSVSVIMNKSACWEVELRVLRLKYVTCSGLALGRPMNRIPASYLVTSHTFHPIVLVSFGVAGHELNLPHSVQLSSSRISRGEVASLYS
jgi:hypothetical protein